MNEVDLAWSAGIIDGEGSIFITIQKRIDRERPVNYLLRVSVQSTDPFMSPELKRLFPEGEVLSVQRGKPNCSDTLKWKITGKKAVKFLELILPYLRVKKDQAKLAIKFQRETKKHWRYMTPEDYKEQERLYFSLKQAKIDLKIGKNRNG